MWYLRLGDALIHIFPEPDDISRGSSGDLRETVWRRAVLSDNLPATAYGKSGELAPFIQLGRVAIHILDSDTVQQTTECLGDPVRRGPWRARRRAP
ncbi:hypothetical protein GCM10022226_42840 [Sphaerisporangium flaviroseum]|uniref:Uncharacterized protein n=1 Tax=Sphaerisporangium flaviroseum TaxID=509199 RepID=A0ABP7IGC9_9ACTN